MEFNKDDFQKLGIKNRDEYIPYFNKFLEQFKINTVDRLLCFLANVLHETANLYYKEEIASGVQYEFRKDLGNTKQGDGLKYKGMGIFQLTGKSNFTLFTEWAKRLGYNIDFVKNPKKLLEPEFAVLSACFFWENNNLEKYADEGDFINVCSIINTGRIQKPKTPHKINGIEDRLKKYDLVKQLLKSWM